MDDQLVLASFEPPEFKEVKYFNHLSSQLYDAIASAGGNPDLLTINPSTGYSSIMFFNFTVCRLKLRGAKHHIAIPTAFKDLIPTEYPTQTIKSDSKYIRVLVDDQHPIDSYSDFLVKIAAETMNRYPTEWSCCSRYLECSNAKTCVHPDKAFALSCSYRKTLNSGRIFYGENRNVD